MDGTNLERKLHEIAGRYGLDALYVFGSRAGEIALRVTGGLEKTSGPSDVDLGAQAGPEKSLSVAERADLAVELENLLQVGRVDLVILQEANPFLALDIIRGELLCCRNPERQAEYELYILRRAADLAYFERERRRQILQERAR